MSPPLILLRDEYALVQIAAAWGGAITRYDSLSKSGTCARPVLRPWDGKVDGASHPFSLACNVLLPWSNRIGGDGFFFEGDFHPLAPNVPGEAYPLHGNGFQSVWDVVRQSRHSVELRLHNKTCKPFDYEAQLCYSLDGGALTIGLSVIHRGRNALPYGIGLHPWLVRPVDSVLSFDSSHYWTESPQHLPLERIANVSGGHMDFSVPRRVPQDWINTAFEGWGGRAILTSQGAGQCIELRASASFSNVLIFSPSVDAGFVCIEPISHVPNAHWLKHLTETTALTRLEHDQSLDGWFCINPYGGRL